jgi:hypothetical protein
MSENTKIPNDVNATVKMSIEELMNRAGIVTLVEDRLNRRYTVRPEGMVISMLEEDARNISVSNLKSFVTAVEMSGHSPHGMIFVTSEGGQGYVTYYDDHRTHNPRVNMKLMVAPEIVRWIGGFSQDQFVQLIESWASKDLGFSDEQVANLLLEVKNLSFSTVLNFKSVKAHGNLSISFSANEGEESFASLPEIWSLQVPVFKNGPKFNMQMRLDIKVPRSQDQEPMFTFSIPKLGFYREKAMEHMVKDLEAAKLGYPILQ